MISGRRDLQGAYQDDQVARDYIAERFLAPLGALLHARQVAVVRDVIAAHGLREAIEIAPGPARVTVDVAAGLARLTIVDASAQMLREARRRLAARPGLPPVWAVRADAFDLPLSARADLVFTFRLIRHFERADRLRLYHQIADTLKPGGWLIFDAVNRVVSEPLRAAVEADAHRHFDALLLADEVRAELTEAGFAEIRLHPVQHRYTALRWCQQIVAPRSARLARAAMEVIDRLGGEPLEWVVVCRRA
jgi:SAM-dependent methyltransferase